MPSAITPIRCLTVHQPALRRLRLAASTAMFLAGSATLAQAAPPAATVNWPQPGMNATHTGFNKKEKTISVANIGSLTQKWAAPIPYGIQGAAPLEVKGVAYAQATNGTVYAVNSTTGAIIWTYAGGYRLGITAGGNTIFTSCNLDNSNHVGICALNAATGAVRWKTPIPDCGGGQPPTDSAPENVPVYDNGMVFFAAGFGGFNSACSGDFVYALNATTGTQVWYIPENTNDKSDRLPFAIDKGTVFYVTGGANVYICAAKEADGSAQRCSAGLGATFATFATLSVSGGKILSQYGNDSNNTIFAAFDETTLGIVWSQSNAGETNGAYWFAPTVADGLAYFYAGNQGTVTLYALSLKTGLQRWSYACNSTACFSSGVSAANGVLFASCDETSNQGDQCALDAKTGALLRVFGSTDGNDGSSSTPLVANGAEIGACGAYGGYLCKYAP